MKIAILHEMLIKLGGAEKVVESWCKMYPKASIFTLIYDEKKVGNIFPKEKINKQCFSLISQKIYNITKKQRFCLPFMARSVEKLDFSDYDVVLCSSSGFAHGAITKPETKFIVYYHSPARYMWDWTNEYKRDLGINSGIKKLFLNYPINKLFLHLRQWDFIASKRVDINLANSKNTQKRITKYYRKDSEILYPPVEIERFGNKINNGFFEGRLSESQSMIGGVSEGNKLIIYDYYIIISALTEFKKIEIAIKGFNKMPKKNLVIIGKGNYEENLKKLAKRNTKFLGAKYGEELVSLVQNSNGLIFPGEEDFGIVPVETMAAGKPVFAYKGGGLLETVKKGITGEFFEDKYGIDFVKNFEKFDKNNKKGKYTTQNCKKQASIFSEKKFEKRIKELIKNSLS